MKKAKHANFKHGRCEDKIYYIWKDMRRRCKNPKHHAYKRYGGRGIKVCKRWDQSFLAFAKDIGPRPTEKHSVDRIDNNGDYTPENCRWATRSEQNNNQRSNKPITHQGKTLTMAQWSRELGCSSSFVRARLDLGWTALEALVIPKNMKRRYYQP